MEINEGSHAHASTNVAMTAWFRTISEHGPDSTFQGAMEIPFQRWYKFKEAYSPLLVRRIIQESPVKVRSCLDVFGGCGTTALTCRFLDLNSTVIEVNPFLADVVRAKTATYRSTALRQAYAKWRETAEAMPPFSADLPTDAPRTLQEKSSLDKWVFNREIFRVIRSHVAALSYIGNQKYQRLFRVMLGSQLVNHSNVVVNGKGRKYRSGWQKRSPSPKEFVRALDKRFTEVLYDVTRFGCQSAKHTRVLCNDSRTALQKEPGGFYDLMLCSPPYPNSFDYTDIYNLELWMLGYLSSREDEKRLRRSTIRSHVQRKFDRPIGDIDTPTLSKVVEELNGQKDELWSPWIPSMVEAYIEDLGVIIEEAARCVRPGGQIALVVGDSAYKGIRIPVATILSELCQLRGVGFSHVETLRKMKGSAQQGWRELLNEDLVRISIA